jgi:hypothetical protein
MYIKEEETTQWTKKKSGRYTSINTTGVTSGAGTGYHSVAPEFTPGS